MLDGTITPPLFFPGGRAPNLLAWSAPVPSPGSYVSGVSCFRDLAPRPRDRVVLVPDGAVFFCRDTVKTAEPPDTSSRKSESPVVVHRASQYVESSTMSNKLALLQEAGHVVSAFLRQEIPALPWENAARLPPFRTLPALRDFPSKRASFPFPGRRPTAVPRLAGPHVPFPPCARTPTRPPSQRTTFPLPPPYRSKTATHSLRLIEQITFSIFDL